MKKLFKVKMKVLLMAVISFFPSIHAKEFVQGKKKSLKPKKPSKKDEVINFDKENPIPLEDEFWKIYSQKIILNANDCSNKSSYFCRLLNEHGYNSDILIVDSRQKGILHAIVRVKFSDSVVYYDVTHGIWGKDVKRFGNKKFSISYNNLSKWKKEFAAYSLNETRA